MADSLQLMTDIIPIIIALVSLGMAIFAYKKSTDFYKYQEVDQIYMEVLKMGIEYPSFVDLSKTKNYEKHFYGDEKIKYENYAYIVWNFCETLYDREMIDTTWEGALRLENNLHSDWFKKNNEKLFKQPFIKYIQEKFG